MAAKQLSSRNNWEHNTQKTSKTAEKIVDHALRIILPSDKYKIVYQPKDFENVYSNVQLPPDILNTIYNPDISELKKRSKKRSWGWTPDESIENRKTHKKIFIEVKHQNGWVEDTQEKDGRGNAHERGLKHFAPGILQAETKASHMENPDGFLSFILLFTGRITRDPRRNRELYFMFKGHEHNLFMWHYDPKNKIDKYHMILKGSVHNAHSKSKKTYKDPDETYNIKELKDYMFKIVLPHLDKPNKKD